MLRFDPAYSMRSNVIGPVIFLHPHCRFAQSCFMYCTEVSYGLKFVPLDGSDVG